MLIWKNVGCFDFYQASLTVAGVFSTPIFKHSCLCQHESQRAADICHFSVRLIGNTLHVAFASVPMNSKHKERGVKHSSSRLHRQPPGSARVTFQRSISVCIYLVYSPLKLATAPLSVRLEMIVHMALGQPAGVSNQQNIHTHTHNLVFLCGRLWVAFSLRVFILESWQQVRWKGLCLEKCRLKKQEKKNRKGQL